MSVEPAKLEEALGRLRIEPADEGAWRVLYRSSWPVAALQAARIVRGNSDLAEDIAQEALIRIMKSNVLVNLHSARAFSVYLRLTVRSVAVSHLRTVIRQRNLTNAITIEPWEPGGWIKHQSDKDLLDAVVTIARGLSASNQELLAEVIGGAPLAEVANSLGVSYSAVAVRVYRLRELLHNMLGEKGLSDSRKH